MPKYTQQAVVFLDILGFSQMLPSFEIEALGNIDNSLPNFHESEKLNRLIDIFKNSIGLIKKEDCNYYLFSDNICITIDYIENDTEKPDLLIEILILISLLMSEFVKEGYFLRGGIDAGWFVDSPDIAVGNPLVTAYKLETEEAIHPRIMLSDNFQKLISEYFSAGKLNDYSSFLVDKYLKQENRKNNFMNRIKSFFVRKNPNGNAYYLNPFFYITNYEEKESKLEYLTIYSEKIKQQLILHSSNQKIKSKYKWFAEEYNTFIDIYTLNEAYKELDSGELEYTKEEITYIKDLKISYNGI